MSAYGGGGAAGKGRSGGGGHLHFAFCGGARRVKEISLMILLTFMMVRLFLLIFARLMLIMPIDLHRIEPQHIVRTLFLSCGI